MLHDLAAASDNGISKMLTHLTGVKGCRFGQKKSIVQNSGSQWD